MENIIAMEKLILYTVLAIPFLLTGWNLYSLIRYLVTKKEKRYHRLVEIVAAGLGLFYLYAYTEIRSIIQTSRWNTQLSNGEIHGFIWPDAFLTVGAIVMLATFGYLILRFIPADKQSPVIAALSIAAVYLGIAFCLLFCIQIFGDFFLILLPANCILILLKTIYITVCERMRDGEATEGCKGLSGILAKANRLPWIALLLAIPLLGVLIAVLILFGQEPRSIIKAWTETADWTLSQKLPPPNVIYDEHYLCTVAAGGHRQIVKPLRTGLRHGRHVIVNRQLCIANAFEQLIAEKAAGFHRMIRGFYDSIGYPIARHIRSRYAADAVYVLMKPFEWLFLLVLYIADIHPEDRIAVQYPHREVPGS